jgi:bifunctional isochorismate lyase/aryl carrier protein
LRRPYLRQKSFLDEVGALVRDSTSFGRQVYSPGATALLVIDMQDYFIDQASHAYIPGVEDTVPRIASLIEAFRENGLPVVFTRHVNTDEDASALSLWWNDLIRADSPMSVITELLDTSLGTVVEKTQYDAFHGTGLEELLRKSGVSRVVVTGVATHLCCETTARSAFVRGFEVTFPVDASATYDARHHLATLLNLSHGFSSITTADGLLAAMGAGEERADSGHPDA